MNNKTLIGVSGKIFSGKDTVGNLIMLNKVLDGFIAPINSNGFNFDKFIGNESAYHLESNSGFEIKKFANKLKLLVSMLTGIPIADLEKAEVKNSKLGEEWAYLFWFNGKDMFRVNPNRYNDFTGFSPDRIKNYTVRQFLQYIGTDLLRNQLHEDVHINALFAEYKNNDSFEPNSKWIITDVRFPNEAEAIKKRGGFLIRVNNPEYKPYENEHYSETALDDYDGFDVIINNDKKLGIENLYKTVSEIITTI